MVSFELGKEIEEDVFRLVTSVGPRKKILSLHEVRFLMRTQFFFFPLSHARGKTKNNFLY